MSKYASFVDDDEDAYVHDWRGPWHQPPPKTSIVVAPPVRIVSPGRNFSLQRDLAIRERPRDMAVHNPDRVQKIREEDRARTLDSGRAKRQELDTSKGETRKYSAEIDRLLRERRREIREREVTWPEEYDISTVTRLESREYRPIDLRVRHSEGDALKEVHHDVFNANRGRDLILQLEFPIHIDYSDEVDVLSRLRRQGNFVEARDSFSRQLRDHLHHPFIFLQYAELLFDMADYNSLLALDPRPAFGSGFDPRPESDRERQRPLMSHAKRYVYRPHYHAYPWSKEQEDADGTPPDLHHLGSTEIRLLYLKWKLLKSLSTFHTKGTIHQALADAKDAVHLLLVHDEIGSTEIQVICLALQAFAHVRQGLPDLFQFEVLRLLVDWAEWPNVYQNLLNDSQIWDFRDLFTAAVSCLGCQVALSMFFGDEAESYRNKLLEDWIGYEDDESISLAQLDMLVTMMFKLKNNVPNWHPGAVQSIIQQIAKERPHLLGTRPVLRWMLADALNSSLSSNDMGSISDMFAYLYDDHPGCVLYTRITLINLPIYIPYQLEVPGWVIPEVSQEAQEVVEMALVQATKLQDYATQVLCFQILLLIQKRDDRSELFTQLGQLQKSVLGDTDGYLRTLLSSYLACKGKDAESKLLAELRQLDNWVELNLLRDADIHLAKQQIEQVLTAKVNGNQGVLFSSQTVLSMVFYPWLSEEALVFVTRLEFAEERKREKMEDGEDEDGVMVSRSRGIYSRSPSPRTVIREVGTRRVPEQVSDDGPKVEDIYDSDASDNRSNYGDGLNKPIEIEIPRRLTPGKRVKVTFQDEDREVGKSKGKERRKTTVSNGSGKNIRGSNTGKKISVSEDGGGPFRRNSTRPPAEVQTENGSSDNDEVPIYTTSPRALSPQLEENRELALVPYEPRQEDYRYNDDDGIRVYPGELELV